MLTGQPPKVFYELTVRERNAFVMVANRRVRKRK